MSSSIAASWFASGDVVLDLELAPDRLVLLLEDRPPAQEVDRPAAADGHEPGARVVRDA